MKSRIFLFVAIAVSMLYGISFAVVRAGSAWTIAGAVIVGLVWIAYAFFARSTKQPRP